MIIVPKNNELQKHVGSRKDILGKHIFHAVFKSGLEDCEVGGDLAHQNPGLVLGLGNGILAGLAID